MLTSPGGSTCTRRRWTLAAISSPISSDSRRRIATSRKAVTIPATISAPPRPDRSGASVEERPGAMSRSTAPVGTRARANVSRSQPFFVNPHLPTPLPLAGASEQLSGSKATLSNGRAVLPATTCSRLGTAGWRTRPLSEPAASDARLSLPRLAGRLADPLQQAGRQFADAVLELPAGVPLHRMTPTLLCRRPHRGPGSQLTAKWTSCGLCRTGATSRTSFDVAAVRQRRRRTAPIPVGTATYPAMAPHASVPRTTQPGLTVRVDRGDWTRERPVNSGYSPAAKAGVP